MWIFSLINMKKYIFSNGIKNIPISAKDKRTAWRLFKEKYKDWIEYEIIN